MDTRFEYRQEMLHASEKKIPIIAVPSLASRANASQKNSAFASDDRALLFLCWRETA
jgi:hypothetical protein